MKKIILGVLCFSFMILTASVSSNNIYPTNHSLGILSTDHERHVVDHFEDDKIEMYENSYHRVAMYYDKEECLQFVVYFFQTGNIYEYYESSSIQKIRETYALSEITEDTLSAIPYSTKSHINDFISIDQ